LIDLSDAAALKNALEAGTTISLPAPADSPEARPRRIEVEVEAPDETAAVDKVRCTLAPADRERARITAIRPPLRRLPLAPFLVLLAGFFLVVGVHDAFYGSDTTARILGGLLSGGGAVTAAAAFACGWPQAWGAWVNVLAGWISVVVGGSLILAEYSNHERPWMLIAWWAIVVLGAVTFAFHLRGVRTLSRALRRVQIAALAGLVVGVVQFGLTSYGPRTQPPHLDVTSSLEQVGSRENNKVLAIHITVKNQSKSKVYVVDSLYRLTAQVTKHRVLKDANLLEGLERVAKAKQSEGAGSLDTFASEEAGKLARGSRLVDRGWYFEPDGTYEKTVLAHVPEDEYDLARLYVLLWVTTAGGLHLRDQPSRMPERRTIDGATYLATAWPVQETSWIHRLTRTEKEFWTFWLVKPTTERLAPDIDIGLDAKGMDASSYLNPNRRQQQIEREYQLVYTYSVADLALVPRPAS
jgi:hypothetical protein